MSRTLSRAPLAWTDAEQERRVNAKAAERFIRVQTHAIAMAAYAEGGDEAFTDAAEEAIKDALTLLVRELFGEQVHADLVEGFY